MPSGFPRINEGQMDTGCREPISRVMEAMDHLEAALATTSDAHNDKPSASRDLRQEYGSPIGQQ